MVSICRVDTNTVWSQRANQLGHKADHSPPLSTKVNNGWSNTSTPPYDFMACAWTTLPLPFVLKSTQIWPIFISYLEVKTIHMNVRAQAKEYDSNTSYKNSIFLLNPQIFKNNLI